MYDRPKGNYSFLIAFAKQLASAIESHRDDDVGIACESLSSSLEVLHALFGTGMCDEDGGVHESVESDDAPGDDTPLGAALARIAELESGRARDVVSARRLVGGPTAAKPRGVDLGGEQQRAPVLTRPKMKRRARRGKK